MELLCVERLAEPKCATAHDPAIFRDMRAFASLLAEETLGMPPCDYFRCVQTEMRPYMRKVVATWMMEVCEEQRCEDTVFPLAVNLLDRFLCRCRVPKQQLQLLGAATLLVASKLRQSQPLAVDLLCYYTDDAFRPEDLHAWELLLVTKLEWRLSAVTALDCADHALQRLPWAGQSPLLRAHAHTLVSVCCTAAVYVGSAHPRDMGLALNPGAARL
ncbi:G1/S-specific cyclin-D2-like [Bacillus rossius redtenbacheri]|uniref:G1/S-specific cyclin-D2-like n=1 Tax=Bacillus rossius redtenbacheri TaxID=93214 RepID=UPI002FDE34FB